MRTWEPFYIKQLPGDAIFASDEWVTEIRRARLTNLGASLAGCFADEQA
jgi:hypothetical protein